MPAVQSIDGNRMVRPWHGCCREGRGIAGRREEEVQIAGASWDSGPFGGAGWKGRAGRGIKEGKAYGRRVEGWAGRAGSVWVRSGNLC